MTRLLLCLLLMIVSAPALAACRVSLGNASLGTQTSFVINSTVQTTSTNLVVECDTVLNLLNTTDFVNATFTTASASASTRATLRRTDTTTSTDSLPIQLCAQSGCPANSEIALSGSYRWSGSTLLGLLTSSRYTLPLYIRTVAGQNLSAGTYQATLTLSINYSVCAVGAAVCLSAQTGTVSLPLIVTLTVTNDCTTISAPNVNFGSAPLPGNFAPVSQSIAITCTKGSVYTVGINNGSYANGNVRNMASGANRLSYEIYKGSTTNRWGVSGAERWASASSSQVSTDGLLRTYNYTARVLSGQSALPAGSYSDTLVVDIAF
ncbi:spore coat U domain-containing protein [Franconibacter pulveris]